ncbi:hypothetical protein H2200_013355 [Cladophialophora chaetospira]|uniref:Uncharacterized protein n=1 Tax=Cladophialophora chaetospira TaxID=386627 RepID=A0AA38WW53_9EURO|nr:hypothetical protein H2200_013355 [Cladophialophora chaetospira]
MMLLTTSLPLLPPPSASLLPPLTAPSSDPTIPTQTSQSQQHHHRRQKHNAAHATRNNTLLALSTDERNINQRKMAIAMYGYSWLKPAGCAKTMLGRREEEVEREEVERQLREVELQERHAMEEAEQERIARRDELGEVEDGRDLDEDIPDAGGLEGEYESDEGDLEEGEDAEGMAMGGDLDDEIPDADEQETEEEDEPLSPAGADGGWVYDTRREPDTDDEDQLPRPLPPPRYGAPRQGRVPRSGYGDDEREADELANAMLNEDEMYDHGTRSSAPGERDLDDDVPDAEDDQAWEHTDTELEESEMDISILPGQGFPQAQHPRRSSARTSGAQRSSGPWISDPSPMPAPPPPHQARSPAHTQIHTEPQQATIPRQRRPPATLTPDVPVPSSNYFASTHRSASTRAARIVSGNRQRPYRPEIARATRHRLAANETPQMIDTPPLATTAAPELNEDLEEVDTDIEGEDDGSEEGGEVDVTTPDPFIAPEHARALGVDLPRPIGVIGRGLPPPPMGLGRGLGIPQATLGFEEPWGPRRARIGDPFAAEREAQAREAALLGGNAFRASTFPTIAPVRGLDGPAATLGAAGNEERGAGTGSQSQQGGARRTLFQRATRRRNPDVPTQGTETSGTGANNSSGGLFSSPNPPDGGVAGGNGVVGEWDTPESSAAHPAEGESQEQARRAGRRRSGRFLGGRRGGE